MQPISILYAVWNRAPSLIRLYYRAYKRYKTKLVLLAGLGILGSLSEAIGVSAVIPIFSKITGATEGTDPISKGIEAAFGFVGIPFTLTYILVFVVVLFLFRAAFMLTSNYLRIRITTGYEEVTRRDVFKKTLSAEWPFLLKQKLGHLETLLMINVPQSERALNTTSIIVGLFAGLIVYATVAVQISLFVTVSIAVLGILMAGLFWPLLGVVRKTAQLAEAVHRDMAHHVNENILGMKTVKSMQVAEPVLERAREYFHNMRSFKIRIGFMRLLPPALMQPIGLIFVVAVFAISYKLPGFNLAAFAAVIYLIQRMFLYVEQLLTQVNFLNESAPYVEELLKYSDTALTRREATSGKDPFSFKQELAFQNVSFSYAKDQDPILRGISFALPQGSMVGLIGPSGSGKTTVVDLLLRLFEPTGGSILVDGSDARTIDMYAWRRAIGYVSQESFLTNDSIKNNIRFYDDAISDEEVEKAARMANIYEFIQGLPEGLETRVGERGLRLSGGERQRIVIARVLARKPQVLILDEATSALDNESEAQIQKVIEFLRGKMTVFIIAHRLSTVLPADRVLALDKGVIIESGNPQDLLEDETSYFYKVYSMKQAV